MAQLRCGILPIRIETGRFTNKRHPITGKLKKNEVNRAKLSVVYNHHCTTISTNTNILC